MRHLLALLSGRNTVPLSVTRTLRKERALRLEAEQQRDEAQAEAADLHRALAEADRKFKSECQYVERLLAQRDAAQQQGIFWLRVAGDQSEALIVQAAARERQLPQPSSDVVVRPVFGRRRPPA